MFAQVLFLLFPCHLVDVFENRIEIAKLFSAVAGPLSADHRNPWNVVHGVPDQRLEINDLLRPDTPGRQELRCTE